VAFSGGPDSTCLLFLLKSTLGQLSVEHGPQHSLEAIHINHNLQSSSYVMQQECAQMAQSLQVPFIAQVIPWGTKPFVKLPQNGDAFEGIARVARYQTLFQTQGPGSFIAFGHHKDDQLETAIMRLANGSTYYGAAGMPKLRRWGMGEGQKDGQTWFDLDGLSKYIIRPLLSFSKVISSITQIVDQIA
jgi:tRNA(Ile)-lysidine synthase